MSTTLDNMQHRIYQNDVRALKELYDLLGEKLMHLAISIIGAREIAEEIIQDVFIIVWQKRNSIYDIQDLKKYLYISTRNISINYFRKQHKGIELYFDEAYLPQYAIDTTPEDLMITSEVLKRINLAISNLPTQCRLIFKLVKEDQLKYREVADILSLSLKTIGNQMGIALKKLHAAMALDLPASHFSQIKSSTDKKD